MGNDTVRQELSKLAKSRKDKVTSQVVVEDNNKGTVKLAEFVIEKNYTRYTVAERQAWEKVAGSDEIQDFFFLPQIHPRVVVDRTTVSVDLRGVYHPIVINAVQYIKCLCEPVSFHSKTVIIITSNGNIFLEEKLLGMPANFSEVFDKILSGATIEIRKMDINHRAPSVIVKENPVLYQGEDGKYKIIVDAFVCNRIHPGLFNAVAKILNAFVSKSVLANIPIIIRGENEIDSGLRLVSINVKMQESINDVVNYFLSISDYAKENTYDTEGTKIAKTDAKRSSDGWVSVEAVI